MRLRPPTSMTACARRRAPPPFAGIPVSIKDLFDIAGDVTTAGSIALRDQRPAAQDAPAVARLRAAGFISIGRSNMTEFAFSGLGINPHYGTPLNPFDRQAARIPGGSSSGAAVSVTDAMAFGALGTDTGGSCRIPAALCGIVGFKPTAYRVPTAGAFPLSTSLDSVGPLAADGRMLRGARRRAGGPAGGGASGLSARGAAHGGAADHGAGRGRARGGSRIRSRARGACARRVPGSSIFRCVSCWSCGRSTPRAAWLRRNPTRSTAPLIARAEKMYDPRVLSRILRGQGAGCRRLHRHSQGAGGFHPPCRRRHGAL